MSSLEIIPPPLASPDPVVVARGVFLQGECALMAQRDDESWHFPGGKLEGQRIHRVLGRDPHAQNKLLRAGCEAEGRQEVGIDGIVFWGPFVQSEERVMRGAPPYAGRKYLAFCAMGTWTKNSPRALDETRDVRMVPVPDIPKMKNLRPDTLIILAKLGLL